MLWEGQREKQMESFKKAEMFKVGFLGVVSRVEVPGSLIYPFC